MSKRRILRQLALSEDDSIEVGTARVVPLEGEWNGARKAVVTEAGKPGGEWCGVESWGVGTVVWL